MSLLPAISCIEESESKFWSGALLSNDAGPACLSFVALPMSLSASAPAGHYSSSDLHFSSTSPLPASSLHESALGGSYSSHCSCPLALPMQSLLPSPFSCSSFAAFFPAHLAIPQCTASASYLPSMCGSLAAPSPFPSIPRWRPRKSGLKVASWDNSVKFSSLASLASSLPLFAEKAYVAEAKDGLKGREAMTQQSLVISLAAGNASLRIGVANFLQLLPSEIRRFQRQTLGSAKKRNDGQVSQVGSESKKELNATKVRDGKNKAIQTSQHLLAGAFAAMVSRTVVAPLERLKLEYLVRGAKGSVFGTLQTIMLNEGVRGFWKGNGVNVLRTAPFKSVNFFAYDAYRKQLLKWGNRTEVTNAERLAAGAAAGITATILCFPLDTIRTIMVAPGGEALGGMIGCFQNLLRTEGFPALYKGLLPAVVSMAPAGAVFYGVYDMLKSAYLSSPQGIEMLKKRRKRAEERPEEISTQLELGPFRTLLYGAIAGACSETVTYPLEVVRRAQQMQHVADKLGMAGTIQSLLTKGGVRALYAGILPSTMQVLPSAALSYFVYESVKIAFKIP